MRKKSEVDYLYHALAALINDCQRFRRVFPGAEARQFAIGIAAGLDFAMGTDVKPLNEMFLHIANYNLAERVRGN